MLGALLLQVMQEAAAQNILLGTSQTSGALVGYGISQKGTTVTVEPVGRIAASGKVGHLFGNFVGGPAKELLQVRKIREDTFAFLATKSDGSRIVRRVRLSQEVGELFYLLTAFDTNGNGLHGVAIIDVSGHQYRWHILEDPLNHDMRAQRPFTLGFHGERIDWALSPQREVEFVAVRQTIDTRRTRALLRGANTRETRVFRSLWEDPSGLLIPVRLQANSRRDPGVALYAPAKKEILLFDGKGGFDVFALPGQRCSGYQAVTDLSRLGALSTMEVCPDGSYFVVQREDEQTRDLSQESVISAGTFPEALGDLRRGDATVVRDSVGELPIPIAAPGSSGENVIQPIRQPIPLPGQAPPTATSTPTAEPTASDTPVPTATPTVTNTPTFTAIPIPMVFTVDTTQTSTGATGPNQFKLPLVPGGNYNFTVYWGDGTQDVITSSEDSRAIHTYPSNGTYTISVYGKLHGWYFNNSGDRLKLLDISQWGNNFRFSPGAVEGASKFTLTTGLEKLEALVSAGGYIWAAAATSPTQIVRFNPTDSSFTSTALASDESSVFGLASDGSYLYAIDWDASSRIIRIDQTTGARIAAYDTGVDKLFSITFDGTYIWAANYTGSAPKLVRFNPSDTAVTVYDLPGTEGARSIISVGDYIFGVNNVTLFRFAKDSQQITTASIAGTNQVAGLAYDGGSVWTISEKSPSVLSKFNPNSLTYESFTAPTGANSAEGLVFDGSNLWATLKGAEVASLLKIPPTNPGAATIVRLSTSSAQIGAIVAANDTIWSADLSSPASVYRVSKNFWPADGFFYGASNMAISATDTPDMTGVVSMRNAFRNCTEFNSDIGAWDVSQITDFSRAFSDAVSFSNGRGLALSAHNPYPATDGAKVRLSSGVYNGVRIKAIATSDTPFVYYFHGQSIVDSVSNSSGTLKLSYGAEFPNLTRVTFTTTGTLPGGLTAGTDYWIIRQAHNNASTDLRPAGIIASSLANAQAGIGISYSSAGTGTHTITAAEGSGWMEGPATSQHRFKHYDDGTTIRQVTAGNWSVWWLYREISSSSKRIFYVSGVNQYATQAEASAVGERADLPAAITGNSILVAKLIIKRQGIGDSLYSLDPQVIRLSGPDGYVGGSDSIKNWNVGSSKSFNCTFYNAQTFNAPLLWDVSQATDFKYMFANASSFNQDLSTWNVSQVTNFGSMFYGASSFNQDLSSWDISSGDFLSEMFAYAGKFNNGDSGNNGAKPLTWNMTRGSQFNSMFLGAASFNQDISSWNMTNATNLGSMFAYGIFNNGDPTNAQSKPLRWYLPKVTNIAYMFYEQEPFNQDVSTWFAPQNGDVMQLQSLESAFGTRPNSAYSKVFNNGGSPNINNWRTPNATNFSCIFWRCPAFNQPINDWDVSNGTNFTSAFLSATAFNQPLNGWNLSKATTFASMFSGATAFNQDLSAWNTSNVTSMAGMFGSATNFNNGDSGNNSAKPLPWDVGKVTTFDSMFSGATSFNQDISTWNVSAATTLSSMFSGASKFNSYIGGWNPASATTFASMFLNAAAFNNGDPAGVSTKPLAWSNTGAVTTLASMFSGARRFNQSLSSFNTSNVTSLSSTFASANSFNQDIAAWDVSKVTSFNSTFNAAASLKRDLSAWSVSAGTDFTNMFASTDINTPGTTDNYDNLLLSLANVTTQNSRSLSGGSARYSYTGLGDATAGTGRAHLTAATSASPTPGHAWSISDGGNANCTFSSSSGLLVTCVGDRPSFTRVVFKTNGTLPTGISAGTTYWTVRVSATTSRLATSLANAQANTVIPFTDTGSGTHAMMNLGHTFTASNSSGSLLLTLGTGGDLNFSGRMVRFVTTGTLPTGVSTNTDYRLNRVAATTYRVMTNAADAVNSANPIAFTDSGSGTHELILQ